MEECFSLMEETRAVLIQKVLFYIHHGMTVNVRSVSSLVVDEIVLPKLRQLAGRGVKVHRLSEAEVGAAMLRDLHYESEMTSQAKAVGNIEVASKMLKRSVDMQCNAPPSRSATKNKRRMGQQAVSVYHTAQQVASYKLRELKPETDEEEDIEA